VIEPPDLRPRVTRRNPGVMVHAPFLLMLALTGSCFAAEAGNEAREPNDVAEARGAPAALPADAEAVRAEVFGLAAGGGAVKAIDEAKSRPDIFSAVDLAQLEELAIRQQIRGGRDKSRAMTSADRFDGIDTALRSADELEARLPATPDYASVRASLAGDRTVAYAARGEMEKAVKAFETIPAGADVSIDALASAGDAYSYANQPAKAGAVYERAIAQVSAPGSDEATRGFQYGARMRPIDLREGLFWSLLDQGRYADANKVLDDMAAALPPADQVKPWQPANDDYLRVYRLRAQYLIYTGKNKEGMAALEKLEQEVPFNAEVRSARADAVLNEGHPREATTMYQATLTDHPDNVETLAGLGRASLATGQYATARQINVAFGDTFPENSSVRSFRRDFKAYQSPQFTTELGFEHGNSTLADNEFTSNSYIYSQPIADYWRVFAHTYYGHANTDIGNISRTRTGIGGDFRRGPLALLGEATRSLGTDGRTGGRGTVTYAFNDYVQISGGVDSNDNTLPWKAYVEKIWGRSANVALTYRASDLREIDMVYGVSRYSDTNLHQEFSVGGTQRVYTSAYQLINVSVRAGADRNTLADAVYFNPHRDYSFEVTAMHQWNAYKNGDISLQQRIYLTGGAYNEQGFGTSAFGAVRLEHAWTFKKDITLTYGIGVSSHAYDGKHLVSETGYLAMVVPF
jgi:biofilm PGA synthesis protein PgaA